MDAIREGMDSRGRSVATGGDDDEDEDEDGRCVRVVIRVRPMPSMKNARVDRAMGERSTKRGFGGRGIDASEDDDDRDENDDDDDGDDDARDDGDDARDDGDDARENRARTVSCRRRDTHTVAMATREMRCVDAGATQDEFFLESGVRDVLRRALDGGAGTVLAYGQTGSGKTYTMSGRCGVSRGGRRRGREDGREEAGAEAEDGVVGRSIRFLFDASRRRRSSGNDDAVVRVTHYEIYEERIIDLLARDSSSSSSSSSSLRVRWRKRDGFYVPNLTCETCASASEALACVQRGCARRRVRANAVNAESSRSHAVLTVYVDRGKVTFVDLAGSERLKRGGGGDDESSRETSLINKSLFALGKVISTLADGPNDAKASTTHVPYRDSKLTKLMMDSLSPASLTLMIACCSSEERHARETVRTLQYAARVASIALDVDDVRDHAPPTVDDADARRVVDELRADNVALRRRLAALGEPSPRDHRPPRRSRASGGDARHRRFSNSVFHTSDVIHRVRRVESLLGDYADENRRLERENGELRARARWLDVERAHALRDAEDLRTALENVERAFFENTRALDDVDARLAETPASSLKFGHLDTRGPRPRPRATPRVHSPSSS